MVAYRTLLALLAIVVTGLMIETTKQLVHKKYCTGYNKKMNSKERKELRYQRRKKKRLEKKAEFYSQLGGFEDVFSFDNLYKTYKLCCNGVGWKTATQLYKINDLYNINALHKKLVEGKFKSKGFHNFTIMERGKKREIQSVCFEERIVQRCLCDNYLMPIIERSLIYDSAACIKHKGIDFALNRMNVHLRQHYLKHGNDGYVLVFDFSQYFKNIKHDVIYKVLAEKVPDGRILSFIKSIINNYDEGLGLGSQVSQSCALLLPNALDHWIKTQLKIKHYARYMDDGYIIHHDKEYLKYCLAEIKRICSEFGIVLNEKKTQIIKLSRGVRFLKTKFILTKTGKIIRKPNKKNITAMRRKLKSFKRLYDEGRIEFLAIKHCFVSWTGQQLRFNSYWARRRMKRLFGSLFYKEIV